MRPGQQQNKRMRNRGGRKGPNPLSRSFESNGPDVKIRGTAQHIADKYTTLSRDAAASGDRIMAENYLQHAEHYGRIVAAAQGQYLPPQVERDFGDEDEDGAEEGGDFAAPAQQGDRPPYNERQNGDRQSFNDRQNGDRQNGGDRQFGDRQPYRDQNGRDGQRDNRDGRDNRDNQNNRDHQNGQRFDRNERRDRNDRPFRDRDGQPRDNRQNDRGQPQGERSFGERGDDGRGERQAPAAAGTGPQPEVAEGGEGAPRTDRREHRRDRQRLQDRSGERRFEERFGRGPSGEGARDAQASGEAVGAEPAQGVQPEPYTADAAAAMAPPAPAEEARAPEAAASAETSTPEAAAAAEPRRRGRPRRERPDVSASPDTNAEVPIASDESPATVSADAVPASVDAPEAGETAAPKRRPGRPRKKKTDGDGGEGGEGDGHMPAFLLASNG